MKQKIKGFIEWYNSNERDLMPTPSNKMWFWSVVILITCAAVKIKQVYELERYGRVSIMEIHFTKINSKNGK